jgi:hypothetical protein
MWPFRRKPAPRVETVQLGDPSTQPTDYPVLTVGQSRLGASFAALEFGDDSDARFEWATVVPIIDPGMGLIADLEIRVQGHVVGYLRPPALTTAVALLDEHHADSLTVPVMLLTTPAGPEVRVHSALG